MSYRDGNRFPRLVARSTPSPPLIAPYSPGSAAAAAASSTPTAGSSSENNFNDSNIVFEKASYYPAAPSTSERKATREAKEINKNAKPMISPYSPDSALAAAANYLNFQEPLLLRAARENSMASQVSLHTLPKSRMSPDEVTMYCSPSSDAYGEDEGTRVSSTCAKCGGGGGSGATSKAKNKGCCCECCKCAIL